MRTSVSASDEIEFIQSRIRLIAKVICLASTLAVLGSLFIPEEHSPANRLAFVFPVLFGALWVFTARGPRPPRQLRAAEGVVLLLAAAASGLLGLEAGRALVVQAHASGVWDPVQWGEHLRFYRLALADSLMMNLGMFFITRAALVPSRPLWTLGLTAAAIIPVAACVVLGPLAAAELTPLNDAESRQLALTQLGFWWTVTTGVCTLPSATVYRLRREVRRARSEARQLGQYTLLEEIGAGGMGVVYRARHALMRRPTAVKVVRRYDAHPDRVRRFEREVQLTAQLTHPNTITVFDYGRTINGELYYAMELLDGATVQRVVERTGPMAPARVVHVLRALAGALEEAHGVGLIHRDIKPGNIILCAQGADFDVPKLLDFGLVKQLEEGVEGAGAQVIEAEAETAPVLTLDEQVVGTPLYFAPEAGKGGGEVDPRSDLYCLGAVAYFMLTGTPPFAGKSVLEVMAKHMLEAPESPSARLGRSLPAGLEALTLRCMSKSPDERPASAAILDGLLLELEDGEQLGTWDKQQRRSWWAAHGDRLRSEDGPVSALDQTIEIARG